MLLLVFVFDGSVCCYLRVLHMGSGSYMACCYVTLLPCIVPGLRLFGAYCVFSVLGQFLGVLGWFLMSVTCLSHILWFV